MNFRRRRAEEPEINLIPFIDVLLVVLIFLMLSTTYSKFTELQLTLPVADADAQRDRPEGDHRRRGRRRPLRDQPQAGRRPQRRRPRRSSCTAAAAGQGRAMVIISADATAAHQAVINVMDAARRAGLGRADLRHPVAGRRRRAERARTALQPCLAAALAAACSPTCWRARCSRCRGCTRALAALRRALVRRRAARARARCRCRWSWSATSSPAAPARRRP